MPSELDVLFCPTCAHDCLAEIPPCGEGHGVDCPDRACIGCGTALLLDATLAELAGLAAPRASRRDAA